MDTQTQMTSAYGHDQTEEPIRIHHPEEEEHHEEGAASKMLRKVKEKAKKMKNSLTKHTTGSHDVEEEEDESEEEEPEVHGAPVYDSSAVRGGVTGQPGSLSHPEETNVLAPEEITPPGTKVFPVVSSKPTEPVKDPEPLRGLDPSYRDEAASYPLRVSDLSDRGESREAHLMSMNTPGEDESFGQQKVNIDLPLELNEDPVPLGGRSGDLSGVSNYQSKVTDPSQQGGGEAGVPGIVESLGKMKMTDESPDRTSGIGFETDLATKSHGNDEMKVESKLGSDLPTGTHDQFSPEFTPPKRREDFDSKTERTHDQFSSKLLTPTKREDFDSKTEGTHDQFSPELTPPKNREDFESKTEETHDQFSPELTPPKNRDDFESKTEETHDQFSPGLTPLKKREDFDSKTEETHDQFSPELTPPKKREDFESKTEDTHDQFSPELTPLKKREDFESKTEETHDQFSPELTPPKKREDFDSKIEETRETEEPKRSTYTETIISATSVIADKAIAAKNAVVSKLGYSTESSGEERETTPVRDDEAPRSATGYGQKVTGTVAEKLTPVYEKVKETGSNVVTKLPLSGGGSGADTQQGNEKGVSTKEYLAEKLRPGEEDKALSEVIAEKLNLGGETKTVTKEVTVTEEKKQEPEEEGKGGGVVERLRGAVPSWLGGTTGEVKEKSSESTQSLGSTVGTTGFGAAPVQTNQESGN